MYLYLNDFTGGLPAIWGSIGPQLNAINVRHNNLNGTLPVEWGALTGLDNLLLLDNNLIYGYITEEWSTIPMQGEGQFRGTALDVETLPADFLEWGWRTDILDAIEQNVTLAALSENTA